MTADPSAISVFGLLSSSLMPTDGGCQVEKIFCYMLVLIVPTTVVAEPFGICAHSRNVEIKVASCSEALKQTSLPSIRVWVYRERARAEAELGNIEAAQADYEMFLALRFDPKLEAEMRALKQ